MSYFNEFVFTLSLYNYCFIIETTKEKPFDAKVSLQTGKSLQDNRKYAVCRPKSSISCISGLGPVADPHAIFNNPCI